MAAEVMKRALDAELIRREVVLALNQAESVGRDHVVKVAFTPADRAIALAHPRELGSNLKLHAATVAGAVIDFHLGVSRHVFLLGQTTPDPFFAARRPVNQAYILILLGVRR